MNNARKVSIIIPIYNTEKYVSQCLESVLNQTLRDIEIICINDGSRDNSLRILQNYAQQDNRIVVVDIKNSGAGIARNKGLEIAKGEYIGFIDSDDWVSENYFEELYTLTKANNADMSATSKAVLWYSEDKADYKYLGFNENETVCKTIEDKERVVITTGVTWNKIYRNSFLKKNNIKCYEIKGCACEDNYFSVLSIILANTIIVTDTCEYYYRQNPESITKAAKTEKDFNVTELYLAIDKFIEGLSITNDEKAMWLNILKERKIDDFSLFYREMHPRYQKKFEQHVYTIFPDIILSKHPNWPTFLRRVCYIKDVSIKKYLYQIK